MPAHNYTQGINFRMYHSFADEDLNGRVVRYLPIINVESADTCVEHRACRRSEVCGNAESGKCDAAKILFLATHRI